MRWGCSISVMGSSSSDYGAVRYQHVQRQSRHGALLFAVGAVAMSYR